MSDLSPVAAVPLRSGHHGRADGITGVKLRAVASKPMVMIMARRGKAQSLDGAVQQTFGIELPKQPRLHEGRDLSFLWCGHGQWLVTADRTDDLQSLLENKLGAFASLSDQSDSRIILELSGSAARATLAKIAAIDFHPHAFVPLDTAMTLLGHISGQITQLDAAPTYELMAPRSFADSFIHDVLTAAAEFGVDISHDAG